MRMKQMTGDKAEPHSGATPIQHPNGAPQESAPLQPPASGTSGNISSADEGNKRRSIKELEEYRDFAAFVVVEYGPQYGFVLERLEQMLKRAKEDDVMERARKILAEVDLKKLLNTKLGRR